MAKTVLDVLIEKNEAAIASATEFLVGGGAKDFAEYKEVCGLIRGLRQTQQETKDLLRHLQEEDDE